MRTLIAILLAGCAAYDYAYVPQGAVRDELVLQVPIEAPAGTVILSSFGVLELAPHAGASTPLLHVRMVVHNMRDPSWTFDTGAQRVSINHEPPRRALFVNDDKHAQPIVTITRGERRVFDFYFEVDAATDEPGSFELVWQLSTPRRQIFTRTKFTRGELAPLSPRLITLR